VAGSEGRGAICVKVFGFVGMREREREKGYLLENLLALVIWTQNSVLCRNLAPGTLRYSFFCSYLLLLEIVHSLFFHYLSVYLPFSVSVIRVCICIFIALRV